jgi:tRNA modification GTPase
VDTIFALSSGRLPSGVAVIRLSGPLVRFGLETICNVLPAPRQMKLADICDKDGLLLDRGLVVVFPSPHSFTGEDCAELHLHGGIAVVRAVLGVLGQLKGFRQADAGEFTKRAFLAGKLDLTQAEGLADLISAETESQRRLAVDHAGGQLRKLYEDWRKRLLKARAFVEASIDFSDEDDVSERALLTIKQDLAALREDISSHITGYRSAEIIRDGFQVVIAGAPNAGKSSLLNALVKRDVATASDEAGTTRDLIDVRLEIGGNLIVLTDTAGLRETDAKVEAIGVSRARARIESADLVLLVSNVTRSDSVDLGSIPAPIITVGTHIDLLKGEHSSVDFPLSTVTGLGISELLSELGRRAALAVDVKSGVPTREWQVSLLRLASSEIEACKSLSSSEYDLTAEHLRRATDYIGRLVGRVDVEDLLDVIFSQFCIGK